MAQTIGLEKHITMCSDSPMTQQAPLQIDRLVVKIRENILSCGISRRALADLARLHHNTLIGFDQDGWNPSLTTLRKLETALTGVRRTPPKKGHSPVRRQTHLST